jgi:hypothetical protein
MLIGARAWRVSTKTGVWYGGLSPHHPFQLSSGQEPRIGPNIFRPMIHAPTLLNPRATNSSSAPVVPPSWPCIRRNVRVANAHSCIARPPTPRRIGEVLIGAGTVAVDGDREAVDAKLGHDDKFAGAQAAVTAFTDDGLFIGQQNPQFFVVLKELAAAATASDCMIAEATLDKGSWS